MWVRHTHKGVHKLLQVNLYTASQMYHIWAQFFFVPRVQPKRYQNVGSTGLEQALVKAHCPQKDLLRQLLKHEEQQGKVVEYRMLWVRLEQKIQDREFKKQRYRLNIIQRLRWSDCDIRRDDDQAENAFVLAKAIWHNANNLVYLCLKSRFHDPYSSWKL